MTRKALASRHLHQDNQSVKGRSAEIRVQSHTRSLSVEDQRLFRDWCWKSTTEGTAVEIKV